MFENRTDAPVAAKTKQVRVLLVDDELAMQKMIERRLIANGYQVLLADNGAQALEMASDLRPDVIVMDVMMPKMSGDEVACQLRHDSRTANIPIIFLTCLVRESEAKASDYRVGENVMLPKPLDSARLISLIEKVVSHG